MDTLRIRIIIIGCLAIAVTALIAFGVPAVIAMM